MQTKTAEILEAVRKVGQGFTKPNDDWMSMLILDPEHGQRMLIAVPFGCPDDKEHFARALPGIFRQSRPTFAAFVVSAWKVEIKPSLMSECTAEMVHTFGASNHPDRTEAVIIQCATPDGPQEEWHAPINRFTDRPPTLGEFKQFGGLPGESSEGRFAGMLSRAFAAMRAV